MLKSSTPSSSRRALLVEDNEENRDMLSRRLARSGWDIVTAVDGQSGVERAQAEQPDVVLMDMSLPVLDGWEATRRIKEGLETCHIPVIALTAHAMPTDRERAQEAGCDDFETKPVDFAALLDKMQRLVAREGRND